MPRSGCYTAALPDGPIPQTAFLSRISRRQRVFLTRTAVLERMSGPLCEAVLEPSGPAVTLAELARSNMLLVPLDRHGGWYLQGIARVPCGDLDGGDESLEDGVSVGEEVGAHEDVALALCERSLVATARGD